MIQTISLGEIKGKIKKITDKLRIFIYTILYIAVIKKRYTQTKMKNAIREFD